MTTAAAHPPGIVVRGRLVLPDRCADGELEAAGGKIVRITRRSPAGTSPIEPIRGADCPIRTLPPNQYVIPGFIDLHTQGFAGIDLSMVDDASVPRMASAMLTAGITSYVATLGYTPDVLERVLPYVNADVPGARMLGLYFEGPFINPRRMGAIPAKYCLPPDPAKLAAILERAQGRIKLMTVAPELDGSLELIKMLRVGGVVPAIGHTLATYSQAMRGIDAGIRHTTHLFNAMTGLSHREPGAAGAALSARQVSIEIIADGVHVHPAVINLAISLKGPEKVAAITDAAPAAGLDTSQPLTLLGAVVSVVDGAPRLPDGTLAGSLLTPIVALRNLVMLAGIPIHVAVQMLTLTPAEIISVDHAKGSIAEGKDADLAIIDDDFNLHAVFVGGWPLWQAKT